MPPRQLLEPLAAAERAELLALKQAECASRGLEFDGRINPFDFQYYCNQLVEKAFQVDNEAIKRYFPLEVVTKGLLDIYQGLLGLKFVQVANAHVWHEDVSMYQVGHGHQLFALLILVPFLANRPALCAGCTLAGE